MITRHFGQIVECRKGNMLKIFICETSQHFRIKTNFPIFFCVNLLIKKQEYILKCAKKNNQL